jgi:hypothetical protein
MEVLEIIKKKWNYILFKVDEELVLTVMFFDQIDYPRSFKIEQNDYDDESLKKLSEEIRNNYSQFQENEIQPPIMKPTVV